MTEPVRYASALFCDDIRRELGNKLTLVGCYNSDLYVEELPVFLPRLGVWLSLCANLDDVPKAIHFKVVRGDAKEEAVTLVEAAAPEGSSKGEDRPTRQEGQDPISKVNRSVFFNLAPMTVTSPCTLRAVVVADGVEYIGGKLHIGIAPPSLIKALKEANT